MPQPSTKILPDKLKNKSHLLYKIQQKHEHWGVPKCALLIGAGCSYPTVPLGSGLIQYCKQLCYIRDIYPASAADIEREFLSESDEEMLKKFISEKEKLSDKISFEKYVQEKEVILLNNIRIKAKDILTTIPQTFTDAGWEDFEKYFLNDAKYGFWMDNYSSSPRERQKFIESLIEGCKPSGAYIILALLIEKKFLSNILTTNFDDFINDTLLYYTAARPRFYADDEISQYISIYSPKPNIIKLHGDYRYANIKNTNDETFELTNKMADKLRELLQNLDLIVIGYNGSDFSIMNVLQQVKTPNCELIWCDLDETKVHWRVAHLINNTSNSWFIKIKGFDDLIKDFYLAFVKTPPNLLDVAKIRQEELSQYIKEYNKDLQDKAETSEEKESLVKLETKWELHNKVLLEKDYSKKLNILNHALTLYPNDEFFFMDRGLTYKELKDNEKAMNDINKAIALNPTLPVAYFNRGYLYGESGEFNKAIIDYNKASDLGYDDKAMLINNYAVSYRRLKEYAKAIENAELGLKHNPDLYHLYGTIGLTYSDMGDDENFYKFIDISLQKGCEIEKFIDEDPGFDRFKDEKRFKDLLAKYKQ